MSIEQRLQRFAAPWVRELTPYKVQDAEGLTKLDAMENPYTMPEVLRDRWMAIVAGVDLNRYPDPLATELRSRLLAEHELGGAFDVVLGNGSDELIHMLCLAFANHDGACLLCPEPTFTVYRLAAQAVGMDYVGVPLNATDFSLDIAAMIAAIESHQPALVFLASPNNPTANRFDVGCLEALCAVAPGLVVLDEAYYRYAGGSQINKLESLENLVVMQTLSKIGMAGLRVGALYGATAWIEHIERVRMPYNINALSQAGAVFALEWADQYQYQIDAVIAERAKVYAALQSMGSIQVWRSETNFILLRVGQGDGKETFAALQKLGVLVKSLSGGHPYLADCLRVTIGTPAENRRFLNALTAIVGA
jgi:histidinol-phosphate aminotransferase